MLGFLSGIGAKAWGYIATVIAVLGTVAVIFKRGERAGKDKADAGAASTVVAVQKAQAEAVADAPKDREEVIARLNKSTF